MAISKSSKKNGNGSTDDTSNGDAAAANAQDASTGDAAPAKTPRGPRPPQFQWNDAVDTAIINAAFSTARPTGESIRDAVLGTVELAEDQVALLTVEKVRARFRNLILRDKDAWEASGVTIPGLNKGASRGPDAVAALIQVAQDALAKRAGAGAT